ncbi:MAG: efflux RND transporter permease subunit [Planctomycetaceae bacterium]
MLHRLIDWLIGHRILALVLAGIAFLVALPPSQRLAFDQSIEALYSEANTRLTDYLDSKQLFGGDELILVCYRDPQLYLPDSDEFRDDRLALVAQLAEQLNHRIAGIDPRETQEMASLLRRAQALRRMPRLQALERRVRELARGICLGPDNQTTAVVLRLLPAGGSPVSRGETIRQVREVAAEFTASTQLETFVVGEPVQVHDMFRYVEEDGARLGWWSALLLLVVIFGLFRNLRWTLIPVLVVWATIVWTRGTLAALGYRLSMVSSMLTSLVTIVGVATVVHIVVRFQELRAGRTPAQALGLALQQLAPAIFWTCATTAAGFGAQLSSHIQPVASFGIMMLWGTLLVLPALGLLVPGLALLGGRGVDPAPVPGSQWMHRVLTWGTAVVRNSPGRLWGGLAVSAVLVAVGCTRLTVETNFSHNFRESSPILQSLNFVESHLGGAGAWEVNFPAPHELDDPFLAKVRDLATRLRELTEGPDKHPAFTKVLAASDGLDLIPRVPLVIPNLSAQARWLNEVEPIFLRSLYNPEAGRMRIFLRSHERKRSEEKMALIEQAERLAREAFPEAVAEAAPRATGLHVLLANLTESLLNDQWLSFALAAGAILAMMTVAFRSLRIGLISLVPNLLAIGLVVGVMGWLHLPINIGTAMIASVAMGLSVDSSIHYLKGLEQELAAGGDFAAALDRTQQNVGSALICANLALVVGFLVLTLSNFIPLVYFGLLSSVAMVGGLVGNLLVLPLLLGATGGLAPPPVRNGPAPQ